MMTKHIEMFDDLGVIKRGLGQSFFKDYTDRLIRAKFYF